MKKLSFFIILFFASFLSTVYGSWQGPIEVVSGVFGNSSMQFGVIYGDSGDLFPQSFGVTKSGKIIIADPYNEVLHMYNKEGKLFREIKPPVKHKGWPYSVLVSDECCTVGYVEHTYTFDVQTGNIIGVAEKIGGANYLSDDCKKIYVYKANGMTAYSPTGQVLKTYDSHPSELGIINERSVGNNKIESTVEYPDRIYKVSTAIGKYSRDMFANFYDILYASKRFENEVGPVICYTVIRVDRCTGEEYIFEPPRSEYTGYSPEESNSPAPRQTIKIEYGEPIVSPLGDLYCWARTKTHYKILKWTWQGPEDAPQSLQISAGLSGLKLNWEKPVKDKETVTGYQILRSTEGCGPFNEVTTVKKDKLTFEDQTIKPPWKYYYVVKAVRDKKYSGDSNKVYMQWK